MTELGRMSGSASVSVAGHEISVVWAAATDVGLKRSHNEDSLLAAPWVFAVADGMGGHAAGDVASDAVVSELAALGSDELLSVPELVGAVERASTRLAEFAEAAGEGTGTTVTGAALGSEEDAPVWFVFNIGDSRTYLAEGGVLTLLTRDHSMVHELVLAGLWPEGRESEHPASNVITRAIGFGDNAVPDVSVVPVRAGSRLLLCSDGLSGEVSAPLLQQLAAGEKDPASTVAALLDAALEAGGKDNVTAIIIDVLSVT